MRMQSRMKEEILTQKDIMLLPEAELETISEHSNLYEFRLNEEMFPVREIYEAASLSGFRDEDVIKIMMLLLDVSNDIVRYSSAVVSRSHKEVRFHTNSRRNVKLF